MASPSGMTPSIFFSASMTRTSRARIFPLTRVKEAAEGGVRGEKGRLKRPSPVLRCSCMLQMTSLRTLQRGKAPLLAHTALIIHPNPAFGKPKILPKESSLKPGWTGCSTLFLPANCGPEVPSWPVNLGMDSRDISTWLIVAGRKGNRSPGFKAASWRALISKPRQRALTWMRTSLSAGFHRGSAPGWAGGGCVRPEGRSSVWPGAV